MTTPIAERALGNFAGVEPDADPDRVPAGRALVVNDRLAIPIFAETRSLHLAAAFCAIHGDLPQGSRAFPSLPRRDR
jgi:hypothetical protein